MYPASPGGYSLCTALDHGLGMVRPVDAVQQGTTSLHRAVYCWKSSRICTGTTLCWRMRRHRELLGAATSSNVAAVTEHGSGF